MIDEAAFHDNLPELMKAAMAFTMWGGLVRVISTHNGAENPFNELVNDIRAGRRPYSLHRVTLDDALAEGLYHRMCQKAGRRYSAAAEREWRARIFAEYGDAASEELLCVPRASAGAFLSSMLIESRMRAGVPVLRWEVAAEFSERPEEYRVGAAREWCERNLDPALKGLDNLMSCFGEDFGRNGDLSVFWPLQIAPNLVRRTPFVVELRRVPFRQQEQILFYIVDRLPRLIGGALDARGNGQYLAETARQRYGARIEQVMLSAQWYRENMPRYKAAFEDGMVELPRDAEILADHRALEIEHGYAHISDRRDQKGASRRRRDRRRARLLREQYPRAANLVYAGAAARGRDEVLGRRARSVRAAGGGPRRRRWSCAAGGRARGRGCEGEERNARPRSRAFKMISATSERRREGW